MMGAYTAGLVEKRTAQAPGDPVMLGKTFTIGIAEQKVVHVPDKVATLGLGSCIGLVLYDPVSKIGGMVHIMLPAAPKEGPVTNKSKFADTGTIELIRAVVAAGAMRARLVSKMAGGAHMFNAVCDNDIMNVGERNIQMCKKVLQEHGIRIVAEDTGGTCGRSVEFCCESGMLQVRTISPKSVRLL
jgi:chemotaxis protein CheD